MNHSSNLNIFMNLLRQFEYPCDPGNLRIRIKTMMNTLFFVSNLNVQTEGVSTNSPHRNLQFFKISARTVSVELGSVSEELTTCWTAHKLLF
jgi:hypothetical protein